MEKSKSPRRIFVVGCSRSGTTVLQRWMSERLGLVTLPETDFFGIAAGGGALRKTATLLGIANRRSTEALKLLRQILACHNISVLTDDYGNFPEVAKRFTLALDELAASKKAPGWIEKTPKHFKYTEIIQRHVPNAHFVHIVRSGPEVVASIVDRARTFPGQFAGQEDPKYAIRLWNRAVKVALKESRKPNHIVVLYEQFCGDPIHVLKKMADRLYLPLFDDRKGELSSGELYNPHERWKSGAMEPLKKRQTKFELIIDKDQQQEVLQGLDLKSYDKLTAGARVVSS